MTDKNEPFCDDPIISPLVDWIEKQSDFKASSLHVNVREFSDTGRGMGATKRIEPGSVIISIPAELGITSKMLRLDPLICELIERHIKKADGISYKELFALFLVLQRKLGEASKYARFIDSIPKSYTNPSLWPKKYLELLQEEVLKNVERETGELVRSHGKLQALIDKAGGEMAELRGMVMSYKEFTWAYFSLMTRCFYWGQHYTLSERAQIQHKTITPSPYQNYAMLPLLDMLNHHCTLGASSAALNTTNNCFEITTENGFDAGDQVFIQYSQHSSQDLLFHYGFFNLDTENPNDTIPITIDELSAHTPITESHTEFLDDHGMGQGYLIAWDGPSWTLQRAAAIIFAPEDDIDSGAAEAILHDLAQPKDIAKVEDLLRKVLQSKLEQLRKSVQRRRQKYEEFEEKSEQNGEVLMEDVEFPEFVCRKLDENYEKLIETVLRRDSLYET